MGKKKDNAQESGDEENGSAQEETPPPPPPSRGMSLVDLILRIVAAVSTMGSAIAVATTSRSIPSFDNFIHFTSRQYQDFPTFTFFVVSNAITTAYLVLSLALSIFHIFKTGAKVTRTVLIILDTTIVSLLTAAASAAAAIAYVAHKGSEEAQWVGICERYNSLCERVSGALVGSFMGILALMLLIFLSAVALSRN
ncbi:casparian strip membrane protein 1-like [Salvia miltiorrhiza]|uniref:casparian strip membrane protein 1-like n=1 Tax=Salvia miltiorrhiza TaxID=226208 RepID=UPI0025ABE359|nr:casparian strip membrane protein 1-like [Salvia miltiorrhiza]